MSVEYTYTDYYAVLGVERHANDHEIKAAFRHLALLYHPDVNPGDDAARRFQGIKEAYEVLGNPARRRRYDDDCAEEALSRAYPITRGRRSRRRSAPMFVDGDGALAHTWRDFWREERRVLAFAARGIWIILRRGVLVVAVVVVALLVGATAHQVLDRGVAPSTSSPAARHPVRPAPVNAQTSGSAAPRPRYLYDVCVSHCPAASTAPRARTGASGASATSGTSRTSGKPLTLYGVCVRHCASHPGAAAGAHRRLSLYGVCVRHCAKASGD